MILPLPGNWRGWPTCMSTMHLARRTVPMLRPRESPSTCPPSPGSLMEKELVFLGSALTSPQRPFVAILGGAKISDKIGVIENLLGQVDALLIGGGMANTFLKADGYEVAESLVEDSSLETAQDLIERAGNKLVLPVDVTVADRFDASAFSQVVTVNDVPPGWRILDIGPRTLEMFHERLMGARTVVWNGPMGVFEFPKFATGTEAVARMLAALPEATTIIGGGDSAAAVTADRSGQRDEPHLHRRRGQPGIPGRQTAARCGSTPGQIISSTEPNAKRYTGVI